MAMLRRVLIVDDAPLGRWGLYEGLQAAGVPLEVYPDLPDALPRLMHLEGGVLLLPPGDPHWGLAPAMLAEVRQWLQTRGLEASWLVCLWHGGVAHGGAAREIVLTPPIPALANQLHALLREAVLLHRQPGVTSPP